MHLFPRQRCWPVTLRTFASPACNAGRQITLTSAVRQQSHRSRAVQQGGRELREAPADHVTIRAAEIIYGNRSYSNDHMAVGRIDYQKSDKHSMFGRYLIESEYNPPAYDLNHEPSECRKRRRWSYPGIHHRRHVSIQCQHCEFFPPDGKSICRRQDPTGFQGLPLRLGRHRDQGVQLHSRMIRRINVTGGFHGLGAGSARQEWPSSQPAMILSIIRGNHQLAFGASGFVVGESYSGAYFMQLRVQWPDDGTGHGGLFHGRGVHVRQRNQCRATQSIEVRWAFMAPIPGR